jgi:hypothetical protein
MVVIFHILDIQLQFLFIVLSNRRWDFRLHTLFMSQSSNDTQYWVVYWRVDDGNPFMGKKSRTWTRGANVVIWLIYFFSIYYYFINYNIIIVCDRYSTRCLLNDFPYSFFFNLWSYVEPCLPEAHSIIHEAHYVLVKLWRFNCRCDVMNMNSSGTIISCIFPSKTLK